MRVLVLVASTNRRGAEIEGQRLSIELNKQGIEAETMALAPGSAEVRLDMPVLGGSALGIGTLRVLRRQARNFDVVIAYGSTTLPASAIALIGTNTPFVYRSIGDPAAWVRSRSHRYRTALLLRRSAAVVTLWPGAAQSMRDLYGVAASKLRSIPNARSAEEFHPPSDAERADARRRYDLSDDRFAVAMVGSLTPEKRVDLALAAVALLPEAQLLIAGDGPERGPLTRSVDSDSALAGRVQFLGSVENVVPVLHASDFLLLTSRTEGMPGVLIEATLCGLAVVVTQVGAIDWLFDQRVVAGVRVRPGASAHEVAVEIERLRETRNEQPDTSPCEWGSVSRLWASELEAIVGGPTRSAKEPAR